MLNRQLPVPDIFLTSDELNKLADFPKQKEFLNTIRDINQTHSPDVLERMPVSKKLNELLQLRFKIPENNTHCLLWFYSYSYRILPVRLKNSEKMETLGFLHNDSHSFNIVFSHISDSLQKSYFKIYNKLPSPNRIYELQSSNSYSDLSDKGEDVFFKMCLAAYSDLKEYDDLFSDKPDILLDSAILQSEEKALKILTELLPDRSENIEKKVEVFSQEPIRRAIDNNDWKEFENQQSSGISWEMVLKKFGSNMMLRIILRRQDYQALLTLFKQGVFKKEEDYRYVISSLTKIEEHNDIMESQEGNFNYLRDYLNNQMS